MHISLFLILAHLISYCSSGKELFENPDKMFIVADDLRSGNVGYHGSETETLIIKRFYTCPISTPIRAGLMTGRYPSEPEKVGTWIQPPKDGSARPIWGHAGGISVGLAPLPGPRGLLRIYAPYLGEDIPGMLNFIALEPIPENRMRRGFSELEISKLDNKRGKRFWSSNDSNSFEPKDPLFPASGEISKINGEEVLTVYIFSEPFNNGARVYVRLRFYETRPYEIELTTYTAPGSVNLDNFILTATMGNKARLRKLYLKNKFTSSLEIWPDYKDDHFAKHAVFPLEELITDKQGRAYFIACPSEKNTKIADYAPGTSNNWKYKGEFATQYWISDDPHPELAGLINGRLVYWASKSPIPGGISIENLELKEPFRNGAKFIFGITPQTSEEFIQNLDRKN